MRAFAVYSNIFIYKQDHNLEEPAGQELEMRRQSKMSRKGSESEGLRLGSSEPVTGSESSAARARLCLAEAVMCHVSCVLLRPCHVSCRALEHSHGRNFQVCLISQPSLFYVILHGDWRQLKRGAQDALSRLRPLQTQPPTRSQPPTQPQLLPPRPHSPLLLPLLRAFLMPPRLPATRTGEREGGMDGGREGRGMGGWMEEG